MGDIGYIFGYGLFLAFMIGVMTGSLAEMLKKHIFKKKDKETEKQWEESSIVEDLESGKDRSIMGKIRRSLS